MNEENRIHGNITHTKIPDAQKMEVTFKKCGIRSNPPAFIVVYQTSHKLKRKVIPLCHFKSSSNVEFVAKDLNNRYHLDGVPLVKIEKSLRVLQELQRGLEKSEAIQKIEKEFKMKLNEDLNKLSIQELEFQKKLMDTIFLKNQIKKDDDNFVYDKQIDFFNEKESSNWDLDSDKFWD